MPRPFLTLSVIKMRNLCNCLCRCRCRCHRRCSNHFVLQLKLARAHPPRVFSVLHTLVIDYLLPLFPPSASPPASVRLPVATHQLAVILTRSVHGTRMRFARKLLPLLAPSLLAPHSLAVTSTPSSTRLPPAIHILYTLLGGSCKGVAKLCEVCGYSVFVA